MSASAYITAILADSPAALWDCQDASGNPQDISGNGHHMTSTGGPIGYHDPGPFGSDFSLRMGVAAYARQAFFDNTMNNISAELWTQAVSVPSGPNANFFGNAQASGSSGIAGWTFDVDSSLKLQVVVQGIAVLSESTAALPAPATAGSRSYLAILGIGGGAGTIAPWTQVAAVRAAGTWKYYINGTLDTANAGTNTPNTLTAGGLCQFGDPGSNWDGRYAYLSYWTKALSATDIANHYTAALA